MNLREYQAKKIWAEHRIPIPRGEIAQSPSEVFSIAKKLNCPVIIKPQLGVKKRGKLGIIKYADTPSQAAVEAEQLFGLSVQNESIKTLLIEERLDITHELYIAVTIDYSRRCPVVIISCSGGVDIEELAQTVPQQLLKIPIDILTGISQKNFVQVSDFIGADVADIALTLYTIFRKYDAELIEINPLIRTSTNELLAADAVLNINDDSLFRLPELFELAKECGNVDPIVIEAKKNNWTYIDLPGTIAILSSGAGLTMTILDLIHFAGGSPANFIDIAQINEQGIYDAFKLLINAKPAHALLINIFAGLNRCDALAGGICRFLNDYDVHIPIVVRMVGNKEEIGHDMLRKIGIEPYTKLEDAVERVVALANARSATSSF